LSGIWKKWRRVWTCSSVFKVLDEGNILVTITSAAHNADSVTVPSALPGGGQGLAIAAGKNAMGAGDDEPGAILIKGFIYLKDKLAVEENVTKMYAMADAVKLVNL
jgi:hypothetical protein